MILEYPGRVVTPRPVMGAAQLAWVGMNGGDPELDLITCVSHKVDGKTAV